MAKMYRSCSGILKCTLLVATTTLCALSQAKQGMWLPAKLDNNASDMKRMGLEIPISKLYNSDGTGLNNAVVLFGRGCTGEVISSKGLILTNHHCGYGTVQGLSNLQNDYFAHGFWAMGTKDELPCPGLTVTFIRKMEEVTDNILFGLNDEMSDASRDSVIGVRIKKLEKGYAYTSGMDATIRSFANGNQYWVMITETYKDIRLVAFPPNGIGSFGGDSDNWMWPRHTGDFSMFRIYANSKNKPADYSAENKPYDAKEFFTINTNGYKEGDFTMVYGFPGTTQEYISSFQLDQVKDIVDPIRIEARTRRLDAWTKNMNADRSVFLKYTSKRAGIANAWKKWQGEVRGLNLNNVGQKKRSFEQEFQNWANSGSTLAYSKELLPRIQAKCSSVNNHLTAHEYIREAVLGVELIQQGAELDKMLAVIDAGKSPEQTSEALGKLTKNWYGFYKNYDAGTDKDVFVALVSLFMEKCPDYTPEYYRTELARFGNDYNRWANYVYSRSAVPQDKKLYDIATNANRKKITTDPAWILYKAIVAVRDQKITPVIAAFNDSMTRYNRLYMKSQMAKSQFQYLYPDANMTLRVAYGKVKGVDPEGLPGYSYQTNLDEAVKKDNPDVAEFTMPARLKELYFTKDYGRWATNNTVPIAFIADNHTSGGNSGSPVLNARGELIGTNFDRIWEGTMSDYYFDDNWCRNITLDIRYTLFIVEKFGKAGWLLEEMKFAPSPQKAEKKKKA